MSKWIRVVCTHATFLVPKLDEMITLIDDYNLDILAVTETCNEEEECMGL